MKKILIINFSDLSKAPRLLRQITALKDNYEIYTAGFKETEFNGIKHFNTKLLHKKPFYWSYLPFFRKAFSLFFIIYNKFRFLYKGFYYKKNYWNKNIINIYNILKIYSFDIIIAHHWDTLPLAVKLAKKNNSKLIFNAHDYYERQFENNIEWTKKQQGYVQHIMKKNVPKFDLIFSAWTKIHIDYKKRYNVQSVIINNAAPYYNLEPKYLTNKSQKIRLIHHGIANSNRKIELMIKLMDLLDERFYLDMILLKGGNESYYNYLIDLINKNKRINLVKPVKVNEIPILLNNYDIGIFLLPPTGINPKYTLPNKLFEFIQGRLACIVSPNIEMKNIVKKYDVGWVSNDFTPESMAKILNNTNIEEINIKKSNSHKYAYELSAERNFKLINQSVKLLTN